MVRFNTEIYRRTTEARQLGRLGFPWDFNLRDILRWAELIAPNVGERNKDSDDNDDAEAAKWVDLLYIQRMRCTADRVAVRRLFAEVFPRLFQESTALSDGRQPAAATSAGTSQALVAASPGSAGNQASTSVVQKDSEQVPALAVDTRPAYSFTTEDVGGGGCAHFFVIGRSKLRRRKLAGKPLSSYTLSDWLTESCDTLQCRWGHWMGSTVRSSCCSSN